jgi:hypothetical protein
VSAGAGSGTSFAGASVGVQAATGRTGGGAWRRGQATARLTVGGDRIGFALDGTYAAADAAAPAYERPLVGGAPPALFDAAVLGQRLAVPALPTGYRGGRQAAVVRLGAGGVGVAGFTPYLTAVSAGDRLRGWGRLAGLERRFTGPFAPFARLPQVRAVGGVARIFDAPLRDNTRAYLAVTYTP